MIIVDGIDELTKIPNAIVTSGTFDGVHVGHQKILRNIIKTAKVHNGKSVVLTFWPHPRFILFPDDTSLKLLSTFEEKAQILKEVGIDYLVRIKFTHEFSQLSSEAFIQQVLVNKIRVKKLVIGYDHKFGKNREGSFDYLKSNSQKFGFGVEEISRQDIDDVGISSTKIRRALQEGEVHLASDYMGRPYQLTGKVVKGQQIGNSIGFPTANIELNETFKVLPKTGVYAVKVELEELEYKAMLNIGIRPTVGGTSVVIEVNIFDFNMDIYGKELTVSFIERIRDEQKFQSLEMLQEQLSEDKGKSLLILK